MAVVPIPVRPGRAPAVALRSSDRFARSPERVVGGSSVVGLLLGTTIVGASVLGLLLYDNVRPIASGALPPPALVISVEPMAVPADQSR